MTTQLTIPPAHVWDRIEKILDKQESERQYTDKLISDTLFAPDNTRRTSYLIATVTGMSLFALIMLTYSARFKNN